MTSLEDPEITTGYWYGSNALVMYEREGSQLWSLNGGQYSLFGEDAYVIHWDGDSENIFQLDKELGSLKWVGGEEGADLALAIPGWIISTQRLSTNFLYKK